MAITKELAHATKLLPKQYKDVVKALKAVKPISIPGNFRPVFPEEVLEMSDLLDNNNRSLFKGGYYKFLQNVDRFENYVNNVLKDPTKDTYEGELMIALIYIFTLNMVLTTMHQAFKRATVESQGDASIFRESYEISTNQAGLNRGVFGKSFKGIQSYVHVSYPDVSQDAFTTDELRRLRLALVKLYGLKIG